MGVDLGQTGGEQPGDVIALGFGLHVAQGGEGFGLPGCVEGSGSQSVGNLSSYGAELESYFQIMKGFTFFANPSYTRFFL